MATALTPRSKLVNFLRELIETQSTTHREVKPLLSLLNDAVEGLIALRYGEVHPLFAPAKKKKSWYGKPYTLRKLKMEALGYADLLIKKKYKGEHAAIRTAAEAYGVKADTFRGWRKQETLGKTADPLMKSFREKIAQLDFDQDQVLAQLKKAGKNYQGQNKLKQ